MTINNHLDPIKRIKAPDSVMDKIDKGIIEAFTQVKKSNKIDNPVLFNQDITELWPCAV